MKHNKRVAKAIALTWLSLESHLKATHTMSRKERKHCGGKKFHQRTCVEYAQIILTLSRGFK